MAVVAALALLCLVLTVPGNLNDGLERVRVWVFAPLFALLIAGSARWEMGAGSPASLPSRVLARLGASSYTLYLWHVSLVTPFTKICFAVFPLASDPVVLLFTLGIALLAVGMAHMIYVHVEQPLVRSLVRRLTQGSQPSAA